MKQMLAFATLLVLAQAETGFDLIKPLIGSVNGGNVFAGASLPYGMAKAVPDVSGENTAGWAYDHSNITGFSAQHDSGTGGNPSQGMLPISVQPYCPDDVLEKCRFGSKYERAVEYRTGTPRASPGYFALGLKDGVDVKVTVTEHTALWNFDFTSYHSHGEKLSPMVLLDLTDIQDSRQNASVTVNPDTGRMTANGTFLPSFGVGSYMSYVCVDFKGAAIRDTGIWVNERAGTEPKELFVNRGYSLFYIEAGGLVRFEKPANGILQARVGVSFLSTEQACSHAESEIPDWNFSRVQSAAKVSDTIAPRQSYQFDGHFLGRLEAEIYHSLHRGRRRQQKHSADVLHRHLPHDDVPSKLHWQQPSLPGLEALFRFLLLHLGLLPYHLSLLDHLRPVRNERYDQQLSQHLRIDRVATRLQDAIV